METGTVEIFDMTDWALEAMKAICARMGWTYTEYTAENGEQAVDVCYPAADIDLFNFIFEDFM